MKSDYINIMNELASPYMNGDAEYFIRHLNYIHIVAIYLIVIISLGAIYMLLCSLGKKHLK